MINFKYQHKLQLHYSKTYYAINISVAPKCLPVVYKATMTNICHVSLVLSSLKGESICSEVFCFGRKLKEKTAHSYMFILEEPRPKRCILHVEQGMRSLKGPSSRGSLEHGLTVPPLESLLSGTDLLIIRMFHQVSREKCQTQSCQLPSSRPEPKPWVSE